MLPRVKQATWTRPDDGDGEKLEVAVKVIKKKALKGDMEAVFDEVHVLEGLDHPNVGELQPLGSLVRVVREGRADPLLPAAPLLSSLQSSSTTGSRAGRSSTSSSSSLRAESSLTKSPSAASSPKLRRSGS